MQKPIFVLNNWDSSTAGRYDDLAFLDKGFDGWPLMIEIGCGDGTTPFASRARVLNPFSRLSSYILAYSSGEKGPNGLVGLENAGSSASTRVCV